MSEHGMHVIGAGKADSDDEQNREQRHDPACETALRGEGPDQPPEFLPLADVFGHAIQYFCGVASCLALDGRDQRDLLEVTTPHTLGHAVQRNVEWNSELLICDHVP